MHNWHKVFLKKFQLNLNRRTCQPTAFPSSYFQATTTKNSLESDLELEKNKITHRPIYNTPVHIKLHYTHEYVYVRVKSPGTHTFGSPCQSISIKSIPNTLLNFIVNWKEKIAPTAKGQMGTG